MYGYQDSTQLAPGSSGGKFGLNTGVFITKFEFNPNAGTGGAEADAIDFTVQIGEREYRRRFFPITKVYGDNGEITDTTSEEYQEGLKKEVALLNGTLTDIVRCFVSEEDLKAALATPISSFKDYANVLQRLVHGVLNWNKTPVDVFLSYQWKPSGDNDKTYLELPKNVKHGSFITKTQGTGFTPADGDSIKYTNEEGITHPFKRSQWFAESAFGSQADLATPTSTMSTSGSELLGKKKPMYGYNKYIPLDTEEILKRTTEEEIFKIVIKEEIIDDKGAMYVAPYRLDNNPDCYFQRYGGILWFVDFATDDNNPSINCFTFITKCFNCSFKEALKIINSRLKLGLGDNLGKAKKIIHEHGGVEEKNINKVFKERVITYLPRQFIYKDKKFWRKYEITKENLLEDSVIPIELYQSTSRKGKKFSVRPFDICYAYTEFP